MQRTNGIKQDEKGDNFKESIHARVLVGISFGNFNAAHTNGTKPFGETSSLPLMP